MLDNISETRKWKKKQFTKTKRRKNSSWKTTRRSRRKRRTGKRWTWYKQFFRRVHGNWWWRFNCLKTWITKTCLRTGRKKIQEEQDRLKIKYCKIQEELEELSYLLKLFILMEILYVCMYVCTYQVGRFVITRHALTNYYFIA